MTELCRVRPCYKGIKADFGRDFLLKYKYLFRAVTQGLKSVIVIYENAGRFADDGK